MSIDIMANAYLNGLFGLDAAGRDGSAALAAWRRAAERGHAASADALARAYRTGGHGVAADAAQATAWQARATELRKSQSTPMVKVAQ
jgi:TPR repeat protein